MNKKLIVGLIVLFALVAAPSLVSATGNTSEDPICSNLYPFFVDYLITPEQNRTYPYSTQIGVTGDTVLGATDCHYWLYWHGDPTVHGDWEYPAYTYDAIPVACSTIFGGEGIEVDVDFDGMWEIFVNGTVVEAEEIYCSYFFVDREELDSSKPLTAILVSLGLLGLISLLFFISKNLDERHTPLKLYLLLAELFMSMLVLYGFYNVAREYLKYPAMNNNIGFIIYVFLIGIVVVTVVYFLIYLLKTLLESMAAYKLKKQGGSFDNV